MSSNMFRWKRKRARDPPEPSAPPTPPHSGVNSSAASINSATHSTGSAPGTPNEFRPMPLQRSFTESVVQDGKSDPIKIKGLRRTPSWLTGTFSKTPNKSQASTSVSKESILGDSARSEKPDLIRFPRRSSDASSLQGRARSGSELSQIPESGISDYFDGKRTELAAILPREKPPTSDPGRPESRIPVPITASHTTTAPINIESKPQSKVRSMLDVDPEPSPKSQGHPEVSVAQPDPVVEIHPDVNPETRVDAVPEVNPTPKIRSMLDVEPTSEPAPETKMEVNPETKKEIGSELKAELKLEATKMERRPSTRSSRSEPKLESVHEVDEPSPEVKPETKMDTKVEGAPASTPAVVPKSASMPEVSSELRPGIIREPKPGIKPEAHVGIKSETKPDNEADAKPVDKPEVKVETKPQSRPVTRSGLKPEYDHGESDLAYPSTPRASTWADWLAWTQFTESQPNYKSHAVAPPQPTETPAEHSDRLRPSTSSGQPDSRSAAPNDSYRRQSSLFSDLWGTAQRTVEAAIENRWPGSPRDTSCKDSEDGWEQSYYSPPSREPEPPRQQEPPPRAGSTWAFWSRSSPDDEQDSIEPTSGEIAVQGRRSETNPRRTTENKVAEAPPQEAKEGTVDNYLQGSGTSTWTRLHRTRSRSSSLRQRGASVSGTSTPTGRETPLITSPGKPAAEAEAPPKTQQNLLLPSFTSTYRMKENPSILKQAARFFLRTPQPPAHPVYRTKETPRIRKAVAIGVHGLFPAPYLRPMIGQPTGTSVRFAGLCADAIRKWADENGSSDCEIEKVALEGDGKINDRVDNLWKLLLNWADSIRSADLVIIACHSQGVPVSVILLEKLIDLGVVTRNKVGVCAMAGVSLGPFSDYKSGIFSGSAAELWDFSKRDSVISKRFEASLKRVLDHGARITFIGAIDDQVVPLESAVYSPANHPNIFRAVFIDGRVHASDFISHLVGFALKLRNLGVSDHGLIRELSVPLAGSLYSGEGHSRLYYDSQVYDLAIAHALQTTSSAQHAPCTIAHHDGDSNPYLLPWIMRGLLEENYVKTELSGETEEILRQFDTWKPTNKALKDVKYRLEAVRSKL